MAKIGFLEEAAKLISDDCFGLNLGEETDTRELGIMHYVFASSATALDAIKNLARYHRTVNSMAKLVLEETDQQVSIEAKFPPGLEESARHLAEWGPTILVAALRDLTGTHIAPVSMTFRHPRTSNISDFNAFFNCPIQFSANRQCITFSKQPLLAPILTADKYLLNVLTVYCDEALGRRKTISTPTRAKVEKALLELLRNGKATIATVAQALAMSPRSLARRLSDEGTNYAAVLDELRRDLAMRYLEDRTLDLNEITWLLGYSEATSFNHAFRRWTPTVQKLSGREF